MAEAKAGKRPAVGQPEIDWARDYERSLIPADMRFPCKGDVYEALDDLPVHFMTSWGAPCIGGGEGLLRKGDRVFVEHESKDPRPIGVYTVAIDYEELEKRMVPESERTADDYCGFYFFFRTVELNRKFRLVQTGYEKKG